MAANPIKYYVGKFMKAKIALLHFKTMSSSGNNCIVLRSTIWQNSSLSFFRVFYLEIDLIDIS